MKAPFNFVPVSKFIYEPDWGPFVSQDIPFSDGVSGEIKFKLTAETPLLVGGDREEVTKTSNRVFPFKYNNTYAIQPSSLKGMLRNVLEIATFSRLHKVEKKRFGIRDLRNNLYSSKFTKRSNDELVPMVKAGWLKRNERGEVNLYACKLARVHIDQIYEITRQEDSEKHIGCMRSESTSESRYKWFLNIERNGFLDVRKLFCKRTDLFVETEKPHEHSPGRIRYSRALFNPNNSDGIRKKGHIVFTEKHNNGTGRGKKKYEFFFYDKSDTEILIDQQEFNEFLDINEPSDGRTIHPTWNLFKNRFNCGQEIPVFWIELDGQRVITKGHSVRPRIALGMAYMFKISHEQSTHDLIKNSSPDHLQKKRLDFATALFGDKADQENGWGLKGRVHFNFAEAKNETAKLVEEEISVALMGPKPSYYPYYVRQEGGEDELNRIKYGDRGTYASYTPVRNRETYVKEPELAGQKRYLAKKEVQSNLNEREASSDDAMETAKLNPLALGAEFEGSIRFHNLRPVELGALFWALTWGDSDQHFHSLGMGKPYGLGRVRISIDDEDTDIEPNDLSSSNDTAQNNSVDMKASIKAYMDCFVSWMDEVEENSQPSGKQELDSQEYQNYAESDWYKTPQLTELMAMAKPVDGQEQYKYMQMRMGRNNNEFENVKGGKLRLRPHSENVDN
jgi:CRISPR-associated protein (TIGR03986 family)